MQTDFRNEIKSHIWKNQYLCKMYIDPSLGAYSKMYDRERFLMSITDREEPDPDLYMSMNPLKKIDGEAKRRKGYEASLKYLYIDLDVYRSEYAKKHKKQSGEKLKEVVLQEIKSNLYHTSIPVPSFVVDSGRGLYFIWKIDEHVNAMPRWERVQKYLHEILSYYGSDPQVVTDSVRVLRVPGSLNTKSDTIVNIIESNGIIYTLYDIINTYFPTKEKKITKKMEIAVEAICKKKKIAPPNYKYEDYSEFIKLHYEEKMKVPKTPVMYINKENLYANKVIQDCTWLLLNTRDVPENGKKELLFYQIAFLLMRIGAEPKSAYQYITEINNRMKYKTKEKRLLTNIKSAEWTSKKYEYCYGKEKLIELLEITKEEEEELSYLKKKYSEKERNRRKYEKKRLQNGEKLNEERIAQRQLKTLELLENGASKREIANILSVSLKTVYRDVEKLQHMTEIELTALKESLIIKEPQNNTNQKEEDSSFVKNYPLILNGLCPMSFPKDGEGLENSFNISTTSFSWPELLDPFDTG